MRVDVIYVSDNFNGNLKDHFSAKNFVEFGSLEFREIFSFKEPSKLNRLYYVEVYDLKSISVCAQLIGANNYEGSFVWCHHNQIDYFEIENGIIQDQECKFWKEQWKLKEIENEKIKRLINHCENFNYILNIHTKDFNGDNSEIIKFITEASLQILKNAPHPLDESIMRAEKFALNALKSHIDVIQSYKEAFN